MGARDKYRAVISSNHRDSHGEVISKELLESMVKDINNNESRLRMGVDHRRDFPPMGRLENAELVEREGYFLVEADFVPYSNVNLVSWDQNLIAEYFDGTFQFAEVDPKEALSFSIAVDPHNFGSFKEVVDLKKDIEGNHDVGVKLNFIGRKSILPDPEVMFTLTKSFLLYHLLKPTVKKIGEKIAEKTADKSVEHAEKLTAIITKTIKEVFFRCVPKARPVAVIFEIPGSPHIELIARTRDEKLLLKSLKYERLSEMKAKLDDLSRNVSVAKIQFLLNEKGRWKFNYLITDRGEAIGTKISFQRRDRKLQLMGNEKRRTKKLKK